MNNYDEPRSYWESRLTRHFDLTGAGYATLGHTFNMELYKRRLKSLGRALDSLGISLADRSIVDVGCGSGFYAEWCRREKVGDYLGLDITNISVARLRRSYPQFQFLEGDVSEANLGLESQFDVALAADIFLHITDDAMFSDAIRNVSSWLKKDGFLILSDIFPRHTTQNSAHVRLRSLDHYIDCLLENSLRVLHIEPVFAILHPIPYIPRESLAWRLCSRLWRISIPLVRWSPIDRTLPSLLGRVEDRFFLPRWGKVAPNKKWIIAQKG